MNNSTGFAAQSYGSSNTAEKLVLGSINTILFILAFLENLLVIVVVLWKVPLRNRPINSLILSLATADFLQSLVQMLPSVIEKFQKTWTMGSFVCKVHSTGRSVFTPAGLLVIALIGVERFRSLHKRDGAAFSVTTTRVLIVAVWTVCLGAALPMVFWFDVITYPGGFKRCGYSGGYAAIASVYAVITSMLFFLVPIVMTWACYMGVIHRMMKSSRKVAQMHINASAMIKRHRTTIRISRTCLLIATVFTICWTPFNIILLHRMLGSDRTVNSMLEYAWPLAALASCINPLVYSLTWKTFREALVKCLRCQPVNENSTTTQG